jgi:hypothetical protein
VVTDSLGRTFASHHLVRDAALDKWAYWAIPIPTTTNIVSVDAYDASGRRINKR